MSILSINCGSSSLKFAMFDPRRRELWRGSISGIGNEGRFRIAAAGASLKDSAESFPDHATALTQLLEWIEHEDKSGDLQAVGHRLVHGGPRIFEPLRLTPDLLQSLRQAIPMAPLHLPAQVAALEAIARQRSGLPQVAVFDTAFHRHMPPEARFYALPRHLRDAGLIRYGFHGLSYEWTMEWIKANAGAVAADEKLVAAHLGSGSSVAAIRGGRSIDNSMGFSPTGGLIMSTRCGDLDPGLILYLLEQEKATPEHLSELFNQHSGLLALSGSSGDLRELLQQQETSLDAALAIRAYCHAARKTIGAYAAELGGLDRLVFTGGIGEHQPPIRALICSGLEFLGVYLDDRANAANAPLISKISSVPVHVVPADEESIIAAKTIKLCIGEDESQAIEHK